MTYQEAIEYLESCKILGSRPGLDSIKALLLRMGNPEKNLRFIHVAGTNGKGSTGSFISHILEAAGYRVGFFSSPAVFNLHETIKLNNINITEQELTSTLEFTKKAAEQMKAEGLFPPTEFEVMTATAYAFFARSSCDFVVAECGMGGRLDATNVMEHTEVSVLCRIALDHVGFLGETLLAITKEKCGILRKNSPVVVYPHQEKEVFDQIRKMAEEYVAPVFVPDINKLTIEKMNENGSKFTYDNEMLQINLPGKHQIFNALVAIEAVKVLKNKGSDIPLSAVQDGLLQAHWAGRFEALDKDIPVILDGAHNLNGVLAFVETVKNCYPEKRFIGIVGMLRDKDYMLCLAEFAKVCRLLVLTEVNNLRTAKIEELEKAVEKIDIESILVKSPEEAVRYAFAARENDEGIFCAGSLYNLAVYKDACQTERMNHNR